LWFDVIKKVVSTQKTEDTSVLNPAGEEIAEKAIRKEKENKRESTKLGSRRNGGRTIEMICRTGTGKQATGGEKRVKV